MKEFDFIEKYLRPLANNRASFGLKNDVAMPFLAEKTSEMVVSKDLFVENVHFLANDEPKNIARRLILSNISDIAASGATPLYYMLGLPKRDDLMGEFYDEFCLELAKIQDEYGISLIGGDMVTAKNDLFFSVTIFGEAKNGEIFHRNKAKKGDLIFVTGEIGGSFLGLESKINTKKLAILDKNELEYVKNCHNNPKIPVSFASVLLSNGFSKCAIDISDGLLADLGHICEESNVSAKLFCDKIPICKAARKLIDKDLYSKIDLLTGGEDYQLLFTADESSKNDVFELANRFKIELNCIGDVLEKKSPEAQEIELIDQNGQNIKINKLGYEH